MSKHIQSENPLLNRGYQLPAFHRIKPEHVEPAIDEVLLNNRAVIRRLAGQTHFNWDNFIQPLEEMANGLQRTWSPVSHMNSVVNSDELRVAYNACLGKLSDYATELGQDEALYKGYKSIADSHEFNDLSMAQQQSIKNALRDFHLSGVDLAAEKKDRFKEIKQRLSQLKTKFEENVLDATHVWHLHITDEHALSGLPKYARAMAEQTAHSKTLKGWVFTLDTPSYMAMITYADDRSLRENMYQAFVTRASALGPNAGEYDNSEIMDEILALRHELALLLGFNNYAELSLATKMAETPRQVLDFLSQLTTRSKDVAQQEYAELIEFAETRFGITDLQAWDVMYYAEKLREKKYAISQEELKPYFPEHRVIEGMFQVVRQLYGLKILQVQEIETWHKDVRVYEIRDADDQLRGQFYLDLYAREKKRGGAWMDDCQGRFALSDDILQYPVAYLTCNLTPPVGEAPALLTHHEVITLFHEFGHGLHHMLTRIDYLSVSGINGVAWDAVELPSQFLENWCWEREALDLISAHYQTGEAMPEQLFGRMLAARNFQSGMFMVRQLEFSIFDFCLHLEFDPQNPGQIQSTLDRVRDEVAVIKPPVFNRFQHSFSHIFAGGYAAGYYSYKWAEVLSADAFAKFEEQGIFNRQIGLEFMQAILEQGGSQQPMVLFKAFRGREPEIDALLRHNGIAA